jgi:hypothetical protein
VLPLKAKEDNMMLKHLFLNGSLILGLVLIKDQFHLAIRTLIGLYFIGSVLMPLLHEEK